MRTAIIHYWLVSHGGGEKVLDALCEMYPDADIYTHCLDRSIISDTLASHDIRTTFIDRLPWSRKLYKFYLPLMPLALEALDLSGYDRVISMESGPSKGVIAPVDALHLCYCHTPMRYLWESKDVYLESYNPVVRFFMRLFFHYLRMWDVLSSRRVDRIVANSTAVAARIRRWWGREATVVHPPVDTDYFREYIREEPEDYYLFVGRLVKYKRADLAVEACRQNSRRLLVVGEGPEMENLKQMAGPNVTFLGWVDRPELAKLCAGCKALLFPGEEDFGIVPVEVMASGRPVIALKKGGAFDYITEETGLFFEEESAQGLAKAIDEFEAKMDAFDPQAISGAVQRFHLDRFKEEMSDVLATDKN